MAKQKLFKSAFRGYKKQEVMKYIEGMDIEAVKVRQELEGKIKVLESELSVLPELKEAKEKLLELEKEFDNVKSEKETLENTLASHKEEADRTKTALESKISELVAQNELLFEKLEKASEYQESFEADKREIVDILEAARQEAKELLTKARRSAEQIISDAKQKAEKEVRQIKEHNQELLESNIKKVKILNRKKDILADIIREHKSKVDSLFSSISDTFRGEGK